MNLSNSDHAVVVSDAVAVLGLAHRVSRDKAREPKYPIA